MQVCNHPELFERKEARTPYYMCLEDYSIPKLVYREGILERALPSKAHIYSKLYIHSPCHVQHAKSRYQGKCSKTSIRLQAVRSFLRARFSMLYIYHHWDNERKRNSH